eukprot:TRINITY_DN14836_c0_g1_i1.p1 TRINITY_DN14836_c0_g1~~TRINITY_DN14836_c0_g1_i1.p1  ORF type:complete len:343 (+),score=90.39 TRINITY_DN14836_c0_g1_i1:53-1081(+)
MAAAATAFPGWGPPGEERWVTVSDGCELLVRKWSPSSEKAKAVVHICHGMAEHSARYGHLAASLSAAGYVVYSSDHRAHGKSAERAKEKGIAGHWLGHVEVAKGAVLQIIEDHVELCSKELQENPGLPLVIVGHSMGSVIATNLAASEAVAKSLAGLVLSGCPARLPAPHAVAFPALLVVLRAIHGGSGVAPLISKLTFEKFNAKYAPNTTDDDWLNRDPDEVRKYVDDPHCGFKMSVDFMRSFLEALKAAGSPETLSKLPQELPVMIINGEDDQVTLTDFGARSHRQVSDEFLAAGRPPPKVVVFGGARHEVLNETCRQEAASDLLAFIERVHSSVPSSRL